MGNLSARDGPAFGSARLRIVKQTIYLTDPADVAGFLAGASELVTHDPPATTMLIVAALADPSLKVEIEVTAAG